MATAASGNAGVGTIKVVTGDVKVIGVDGVARQAQVGDKVFARETIQTNANAIVQVQLENGRMLDLGRDSKISLDNDVIGTQGPATTQAPTQDIAALQAQIAAGADPSKVAEATAAGGAPGAGGGADGGGGTAVYIDQANSKGLVTSGFITGPAGIAFPDIQGEEFINRPPIVVGERANVSEEGLAGANLDENGNGDTTDDSTIIGSMDISDPDGNPFTVTMGIPGVTLTSGGETIVWELQDDGHTLIGKIVRVIDGGEGGPTTEEEHIIEVFMNDTGNYEIRLLGPIDHPDGTEEDDLDFDIPVTATDVFGLSGTGFLNVNVEDDSPTLAVCHDNEGGGEGSIESLVALSTQAGQGGNSLVDGLGGPAGFGENTMFRNDDGSTGFINVTSIFPTGMNFYGATPYTGFYINNNGNITFNSPLGTFTPFAIVGNSGNPMIAPFFADVDTRPTSSHVSPGGTSTGTNAVYWDLDTDNGIITITWNDVGYFSNETDLVNAFQLRIFNTGGGNFGFEFRYENVEWTTGGASGGSGGLGGTVARAGWTSGDGVNFFELPQSGNQSAILNLETTSNANTPQDGNWVFNVVGGQVVDHDCVESVTATVREDGMRLTTGDLSDGNQTIVNTGADEAISATGSLRVLYSFGADGPGNFVMLTDTSGLPELYSQGEPVEYDVEGNVLTATADGRDVFTLTLNANGSWTFDLMDQLDHVDSGLNDENTMLFTGNSTGQQSVGSIDFSSLIEVTDGDGDKAPALPPGSFAITVVDDIPVAEGGEGAFIRATVQEDDMTGIAGGDLSTGNNEDGSTNQDETSGGAGSLNTLFRAGADEELTYSIKLDQEGRAPDLPTLYSQGEPVEYDVSDDGHTLTATADGRTVFILTVNADGSWNFDLQDQLDHTLDNNTEGNWLRIANSTEGVPYLDFTKVILATDVDGDSVERGDSGRFTITVQDDIPVHAGGEGFINAFVQEDDMTGGEGGDLSVGNNEDGSLNKDEASSALSGSLATLVSAGADEDITFSIKLDQGDLPQLYSQGDAVGYDVSNDGHTLTATADGRTVFTLNVNSDGSWSFDLRDQLDHVDNGLNDENTLLFTGNSTGQQSVGSIDFSKLILVTDADGDELELLNNGDFTITVQDDIPVLTGNTITVTVDEDDIDTNWSEGTSPNDGNADGSNTEAASGPNDPAIVTGSLAGLASIGSDEPPTYGFTANVLTYMQGLGLFSKQTALPENGQALTYSQSSSGGWVTLTATEPDTFGFGDTSNPVFTLKVNTTTGAYEFRLFDELIHKAPTSGADENFDLRSGNSGATISGINFGAIIEVTDTDGDSITLNNAFTVTVRDDIPEVQLAVVGQSGVTHDESSGTQNNDVSGFGAIVPALLFLSVSNTGNDPDVADVIGPDVIGYAYSGTAVVTTSGTEVGADSPPLVNSLSLEVLNPVSGLMTTEGSPITLSEDSSGRIVGRDGNGQAAFAIALDSDGKIFVVQYLSIKHPTGGASHDEEVNLGNTIAVQYQVTDSDGDTVVRQVTIGDRVRFGDDGPTVNVTVDSRLEASVALTTQDADTDGNPTDSDTMVSSANFSGVFAETHNYGADGPGTTTWNYVLSLQQPNGTASGMFNDKDQDGGSDPIYLYNLNGLIVGSTSTTPPLYPEGEHHVFTLSVAPGTGVVTLTQFKEIDHVNDNDGGAVYDDQFAVLANGLVSLTGTATTTDGDGDVATDTETIDMGGNVRFADDGPSLTGQTVTRTVDEDDINTAWSEGTNPYDGNADGSDTENNAGQNDPAFVSGTLAGLVNSGADSPIVSYTFTANALTFMQNLHLYSKQSALPENGQELTYTVSGPTLGIITLTATEPDTAGFGDTSNPVFELKLNTATGQYEFRLFDELIHKAPTSGADENFDLRSGPGTANTIPGINFGAIIKATDDDGDYVTLNGAFTVNVRDDIPEVQMSIVGNPDGVLHDESTGNQNDDVGGFTALAVAGLFAGVTTPGNDPDVPPTTGAIGYAMAGSVIFSHAQEVGADAPAAVSSLSLQLLDANSGLKVTDGSPITLVLEGDLIVGRVVGGAFDGQAAFAVAAPHDLFSSTVGRIYVAQYLSLQHPIAGDADEEINLAGKIAIRYTVTDSDGDTVYDQEPIGQLVRFDDDGPVTSSNSTVRLDDDALAGGNAGGTGDDADAVAVTGTLGHNFGADGAGSVAYLTTGAPAGFSYELSGSNLLVKQGTVTVMTLTVNPTSGAYTVTQNAPIQHAAGGDENNQSFAIAYRVTDGDGDTADGSLSINVDDDTPTVTQNAVVQLDDDALANGNPGGTGDDADSVAATGTLGHSFGADGAGAIAYLTGSAPAGFSYVAAGSNLLVKQGSVTVLTLTVDSTTGAYTVTQNAPIQHALGNAENNQVFNIGYSVTDKDGDTVNGALSVNVDDDTPTVTLRGANEATNGLFLNGFVSNSPTWGTDSGIATGTAGSWTITGPQLERVGQGYAGASSSGGLIVDMEASPGNVSISQAVNGLTTGEKYRLAFEIGEGTGNAASAASLEVYWNGVLVGTFDGVSGVMQQAGVNVIAAAGTNTVEFREVGTSGDDTGTYLSNIRLVDPVIVDESAGLQDDDTTNAAVIAQFAGVTNPGTDPDMATQYAAGTNPVVIATPSYGADGPGTLVYELDLNNAASGLSTTSGKAITLFQVNDQLIVGRYDSNGDTVVNASDDAAFAIAINSSTGVASIAQYVSLQHPNNTADDEGMTLAAGSVGASAIITDSDGDTAIASVANISGFFRFEDDAPAQPDNVNKTISEGGNGNADTNVMLVLDVSGSMGGAGITTLKSSAMALLDAYDALGAVKVRIVTFSSNAAEQGSVWVDIGDIATAGTAKYIINNLGTGGLTNFDEALTDAMDAFGDAGKIVGANNVSYFISDGNPNQPDGDAGIQGDEETAWETFLNNNEIKSYALGMGTSINVGNLNPIAYDGIGAGAEMNAVVVDDLGDLTAVLLATVGGNTVEGDLVTEGTLSGEFGADGPGVPQFFSIVHDGVTYLASAGNPLTIATTDAGGKFEFNFTTGAYKYTAPANVDNDTTVETFTYTIVDGDGDKKSANLNISVLDGVPVAVADAFDAAESFLVASGSITEGMSINVPASWTADAAVVFDSSLSINNADSSDSEESNEFTLTSNDVDASHTASVAFTVARGDWSSTDRWSATLYREVSGPDTPVASLTNQSGSGTFGFTGITQPGNYYVVFTVNDNSSGSNRADLFVTNLSYTAWTFTAAHTDTFSATAPDVSWNVVPTIGNVLTNDIAEADGVKVVTTTGVFDGAYGTLVLNANGSFTYTPDSTDFSGAFPKVDTFSYTMRDGSSPADTSTAILTINLADHNYSSTSSNSLVGGEDGNDSLSGNDNNQVIYGGAGNDNLNGSGGNDHLIGGAGDDTLRGEDGNDILVGGSGADTFVWEDGDTSDSGVQVDVVMDFGNGADKLDLQDLLDNEDRGPGNTAGDLANYLSFSSNGTDTLVSIKQDGSGPVDQQIVLKGVDLTAGNTLTSNQIIENLFAANKLITD